MLNPTAKSDNSDDNPNNRIAQAENRDEGARLKEEFSARLRSALEKAGKDWASLARETGLPTSTINDMAKGTIPRADRGVKVARALGRTLEWLITGVDDRKTGQLSDAADSDWVFLPRYDLLAFEAHGKPEPVESIPVRKDWLAKAVRQTTGLWLTEMPSEAMEDVAHEGDLILCRDAPPPLLDGRVYVFLLDGRPIVRRVAQTQRGRLVLKATDPTIDPMTFRLDELESALEGLAPVGRVLGSITLQPTG